MQFLKNYDELQQIKKFVKTSKDNYDKTKNDINKQNKTGRNVGWVVISLIVIAFSYLKKQ